MLDGWHVQLLKEDDSTIRREAADLKRLESWAGDYRLGLEQEEVNLVWATEYIHKESVDAQGFYRWRFAEERHESTQVDPAVLPGATMVAGKLRNPGLHIGKVKEGDPMAKGDRQEGVDVVAGDDGVEERRFIVEDIRNQLGMLWSEHVGRVAVELTTMKGKVLKLVCRDMEVHDDVEYF